MRDRESLSTLVASCLLVAVTLAALYHFLDNENRATESSVRTLSAVVIRKGSQQFSWQECLDH